MTHDDIYDGAVVMNYEFEFMQASMIAKVHCINKFPMTTRFPTP